MDLRIPLLAFLLLLPATAAIESYEDPAGDVRVRTLNQWSEAATGWDGVDLTALRILEDPSFFRFEVDVADLSTNEGGIKHDASTYLVRFEHGGRPHAVSLVRNLLEDAWYGNLYEVDPTTGSTRWLQPLDAGGSDAEDGGWLVAPREAFLDRHGAPPVAGNTFEDLTVRATAHAAYTVCCVNLDGVNEGGLTEARDLLEGGTYTVLFGGQEGTGGARLDATHPFRASNGGATTLQYAVQASLEGPRDGPERTFRLSAKNVPSGWSVAMPWDLVLAPGSIVDLEVLVEVPFVHQHGGSATFDVVMEATDDGDEASARVQLGVHYLDVPQPSGHHPRLWLHSIALGDFNGRLNSALGGADGRLFMNALEDDPADEGVDVVMGQWGIGGTHFRLYACLEPSLLMGLDLDLDSIGTIEVPVRSDLPVQASLQGRLLHLAPGPEVRSCYPGSWDDRTVTELATFAGTATGLGSTPTLMEASLLPASSGDRIPHADGAQMVLELIVVADGTGRVPGSIVVTPGGLLDLPLFEYHDNRPAGLVGEPLQSVGPNGTVEAPSAADKESPGAGVAWIGGVVLVVALVVRRRLP